ncbi:hydroxylase [Pseudonocardia sp. KRD291]|uniref:hydroxylase n=1 Tax=Pseudonocardia sp. KRD291 TaxID=2792007 RepID=UPI001C4A5398|nr:hydroxylase [Pseudonocardia sp. KRD291]MBW0106854.1 hydroxylase [Pseudonocardia sp. KRD291]
MVVDHLLARGASDVRALTADPERAALPPEVEAVRGSMRRPETLREAFEGVERFYLAPSPETVGPVLATAREAGATHVVDLSGEPESWWGSVSGAVEASGLAWTHLWPADFVENVRMWLPQIRATGQVREPDPDASSTPTAMDDIAEVAAVALLCDDHAGHAYPLTGPEPVSRVQMVRAIAEVTGRDVEFVTSTPEETAAALRPGMGEDADWFVHNVLPYLSGNEPAPNRLVEDITGRPGTTFTAWAHTHAADLRAALS